MLMPTLLLHHEGAYSLLQNTAAHMWKIVVLDITVSYLLMLSIKIGKNNNNKITAFTRERAVAMQSLV